MSQHETTEQSQKELGLHLDKKTVLFIFTVIVGILLLVGVLTQVVPRGEYLRDADGTIVAMDENGDSTYTELDFRLPFWKTFTAPIEVFGSSDALTGVAIIVFIVLIGGTFLILDKSGVLTFIMSSVVLRFSKRKYLLLPVVILIMMTLSSVVGILEESITIVPLCVAIALALGWDSLVGLSISLIAIAFGYSAATFNPFNVVLVQSMAGLPIFSGLGFRLLVFIGVYAILTAFVTRLATAPERLLQTSGSDFTPQSVACDYIEALWKRRLQQERDGLATDGGDEAERLEKSRRRQRLTLELRQLSNWATAEPVILKHLSDLSS